MLKIWIGLLTSAIAVNPAWAQTIVIHAGHVMTDAASPILGASTITVTDGRIVSVTPGYQPAAAVGRVINVEAKTLLPGLIDSHVHLSGDPGGDYRSEAVEPIEWGVPIAFGTNSGVFEHGRNAGEFAQMVELGGLTRAQAIATATTGAAKLLGLENEVGRIAPGYSADIIAVSTDPIGDIRVLEKVDFVMVRGTVIE